MSSQATRKVVSWRNENVKHDQQLLFVIFREQVVLSVDEDGNIVDSECFGQLFLDAQLSGTPVLYMGLNEPATMRNRGLAEPGVPLEVYSFHESVNRDVYGVQAVLKLIPADGQFELLRYKMTETPPPLPFWITATERTIPDEALVLYLVKLEARFPPQYQVAPDDVREVRGRHVTVRIPVLEGCKRARFYFDNDEPAGMTAVFDEKEAVVEWKAPVFPGGGHAVELRITLDLPKSGEPEPEADEPEPNEPEPEEQKADELEPKAQEPIADEPKPDETGTPEEQKVAEPEPEAQEPKPELETKELEIQRKDSFDTDPDYVPDFEQQDEPAERLPIELQFLIENYSNSGVKTVFVNMHSYHAPFVIREPQIFRAHTTEQLKCQRYEFAIKRIANAPPPSE